MTRQPRRRAPKPRQSPAALDRLHPHAAGIDCGSAEHFVAVPPDRDPTPVRSFPTFTGDLHRLADWLTACRVTHVAMEATGVYWIPIFEILDARGFQVILVNARHVKNLPGRKSDVSDGEWLRDLHILGLLRGSFRPADGIVALRGVSPASDHAHRERRRPRATHAESVGPDERATPVGGQRHYRSDRPAHPARHRGRAARPTAVGPPSGRSVSRVRGRDRRRLDR